MIDLVAESACCHEASQWHAIVRVSCVDNIDPSAAEPTEVIHVLRRVNLLAKNRIMPELIELVRQDSLVALEYRWSS